MEEAIHSVDLGRRMPMGVTLEGMAAGSKDSETGMGSPYEARKDSALVDRNILADTLVEGVLVGRLDELW